MTRFCPYCGKPLSDRSKFCPKCGKASPQRRTTATLEPDEPAPSTGLGRATESGPPRVSQDRPAPIAPRVRPVVAQRSPNGGSAVRRYAPATHALIGAFEQAGFGLRYGAWMFDFLITLIALMTSTFVVTALSRESVVNSNTPLYIVAGITLLLFVLNFVVLAGSNGQSAGMRILGIYIARVNGRPFTMKDAALRHLVGYPLSTVVFFLGFLWMLWDPRQQGWHDKIAKTIIVMSK